MEYTGMTTMEAIQSLKEVNEKEEQNSTIDSNLFRYIQEVVFPSDSYNVTNSGENIASLPLLVVTSLRDPSKFRVFVLVIEYNGDESLFSATVFKEFKQDMKSMGDELKLPVAFLSATLKRDSSIVPAEERSDMLMNEGYYYETDLTFI